MPRLGPPYTKEEIAYVERRRAERQAGKRIEFSKAVKKEAYERSKGSCESCGDVFGERRPEYHHRIEAFLNGKAELENCIVLCVRCHRRITQARKPVLDKVQRIIDKKNGTTRRKQRIPNRGWQRYE